LTGPIGALVIFIISHWDDIKEKTGDLVDKVKEKFQLFKDKLGDLKDSIKDKVQSIKDFFMSIPEAVANGFSNMVGNAKNGINALIRLINDQLIGRINDSKLAKLVNLSIPEIPEMAAGGRVVGIGGPTQDNQLRALSAGEYVIKTAAAQRIGYDNLDRANRTGQLAGAGGGGDVWQIYPSQGMDETELAHKIYRQVRFNRRAGA
jgi:mevalonate kinase